jgi:exosortase/archaeosortase family protein
MLTTKLFLVGQVAAFWPVWRWYIQRMMDGSDEPWGILACITVLVLLTRKGAWTAPSVLTITICSAITAIYALNYASLPPLFRGVLAVIALALSLSSICYGRTLQAGIAGLMLVSLPLIASLQFYGGFPIRVITAFVSSHLLGLFGYQVQAQGTLLYWLGEIIAVDAPCAGIKMLWTALYLNFTLAAWRDLGFLSTWLSTSVTLFSVFIGNILRATLLFFTESGILTAPNIAHEAIGTLVFAFVALAILNFHRSNGKRMPCVV